MSSPAFEAFLARLYVDADARSLFLADPQRVAREAGLTGHECEAVARIDRVGLMMAAESLRHKRERQSASAVRPTRGRQPRAGARWARLAARLFMWRA